jgi:hypothetical protein
MYENFKFKIIDKHTEQLENVLQVRFYVQENGDLGCDVFTPDDPVGMFPYYIFTWNIKKGICLHIQLNSKYFPVEGDDNQLKLWKEDE